MSKDRNTSSPRPWQSLQNELLHSGIVSVTGSLLVDLGLNHSNFVPAVSLNGSTAANANAASVVTWAYGTQPGTFTIFTWKATAAGTTTLIAATAAVSVSFTVIADSPAGI
jgi:hypothetical protein